MISTAIRASSTADVGRHGHDVCRTPVRYRGHGQRGSRQPILAQIGDAHAQAQARERFGRGKTDAGRTAGDDSHGTGRQGRMGQG